MMKPGQFCWNELATPDQDRAKEFYHQVFGWGFREIETGTMTYTIVTSKDQDIAGMWQIPSEMQGEVPPHWMSYILVEDVKSSLKLAIEHGAKQIREIIEVVDMGKFAIISDPTGAYIAFWEAKGE